MKSENIKKYTKISKIIKKVLFLRFSQPEISRLMVLLKLLKIKESEAHSSLFWRKLYQKYPNIFDFIMEN